jgi:hypothetical protein
MDMTPPPKKTFTGLFQNGILTFSWRSQGKSKPTSDGKDDLRNQRIKNYMKFDVRRWSHTICI